MIRTSLNLPIQLHHQLQFVAKWQNKTMSDVVRHILEKELAQQKQARLKRVYQSLAKVKGISKDAVTDGSATINERLYGSAGAWKGRHE